MKYPTNHKAVPVLYLSAALILILVPFHAFITTWAISNFGHPYIFKSWKELLILAITPLAVWVILGSASLRNWFLTSWLARAIAFYFGWHFLMGLWALRNGNVNEIALANGLLIDLRFLAFFVICLVAAHSSPFLYKNWGRILIIPALATVAFGLAQHFLLPRDFLRHFGYGPTTIQPYQTVDANLQYVRVQSFLRGANPFGAYLVVAITALIAYSRKSLVRAVCILVSVVALFYSYSRSAWLGVVLSVGLFFWLNLKKNSRLWLAGAAVAMVLVAGAVYGLRNNNTVQDIFFHHTVGSQSPQTSNVVRNSAMKNGALEVVREPMGRGPGTAGPASFRNDRPVRIAENYYIQIAQETGLIGLTAFLAILVLVANGLWSMRQGLLPKVLLSSLLGISFINLVSHAWADDTLSLLWWGLAGIAMAGTVGAKKLARPGILAKKVTAT